MFLCWQRKLKKKRNAEHKYATLVVNEDQSMAEHKITHGNNLETSLELLAIRLSLNHLEKVTDLPEKKVITTKCLSSADSFFFFLFYKCAFQIIDIKPLHVTPKKSSPSWISLWLALILFHFSSLLDIKYVYIVYCARLIGYLCIVL